MPPSGRPLAWAPPASAASSSSRPGCGAASVVATARSCRARRWLVSSCAQLVAWRGADMAVGADAEAGRRPPGRTAAGRCRRRARPRSRGRARRPRRSRPAPRSRRRPYASRGSGTSAASTGALSSSHCTGRAPVAARHSATSRSCSAAWMWIGPGRAATACSMAGVTARRLCGAMPTAAWGSPAVAARQASTMRSQGSRSFRKRRCPGTGSAAEDAAMAIEAGQQGDADPGPPRRRQVPPRHLARCPRRACRRAGDAGSGIRRYP